MFWNKISPVYDLFENVYNRKVYKGTSIKVSEYIDDSDRKFFEDMGYNNVCDFVVEGRMPCAIAVIEKV